jgi:hypothetical protein
VSLSQAFDLDAIDKLLFLSINPPNFLIVSGDGALSFARLTAAGLTSVQMKTNNNWQIVTYAVNVTAKGTLLIDAWKAGDRTRLHTVLYSNEVSLDAVQPTSA